MNIVYVYESGFTFHNGSNHLHQSIIEKLLKDGNTVHLIQSAIVEYEAEYPNALKNDNFHCHTIKLKKVKKSNFVGRYLNGLTFCKRCKKLFKEIRDKDVFFFHCSPTVSFNINNAKKYKKPIIYNIYDVFPGCAYDLGIIKTKLFDAFLKRVQRIGYKKSDAIIVMSDDMKDKIVHEGILETKISVVNSWFDSDQIHTISNEDNSFVRENSIDTNKLIVQYAGNIGQVFAIEEFAKLVNLLKNNNNIEFHIIGDGIKLERLKQLTTDCKNIKYYGWQPQSKMNEIYSYCDIEIIPLHRGVIGNNVPSKTALALACGKRIISIVEESHYYHLFEDNGVGFSFSHLEMNELKDKLVELSMMKKQEPVFNQKCIDFSKKYYSKQANVELLTRIIYQKNQNI